MMFYHAAQCGAAALASGKNWRISVAAIECEAAESLIVIGAAA